MPAITVANLSKTYPYHRKAPGLRGSIAGLLRRQMLETRAVDQISFQIEPGEIVGFLGPNGAGKTTTLKMLCELLYPDGGRADVLGHTPAPREAAFLRQISLVMSQKSMLT
ncbi:MAG TPA: ATP-binding cassette domain-containing protein [Roseiflexaceae bacterium]|nr:ATP-binding cassette domain-containing protein [Roseiflexaceae bacterium]